MGGGGRLTTMPLVIALAAKDAQEAYRQARPLEIAWWPPEQYYRRRPAAPALPADRPCPVPAVSMTTTSSLKHRLIITAPPTPAIFGDRRPLRAQVALLWTFVIRRSLRSSSANCRWNINPCMKLPWCGLNGVGLWGTWPFVITATREVGFGVRHLYSLLAEWGGGDASKPTGTWTFISDLEKAVDCIHTMPPLIYICTGQRTAIHYERVGAKKSTEMRLNLGLGYRSRSIRPCKIAEDYQRKSSPWAPSVESSLAHRTNIESECMLNLTRHWWRR